MRGTPDNRTARPGKHIINNYSMLFFLHSISFQKYVVNVSVPSDIA